MEQDNAETSGGGFVPKPMDDILSSREPAPAPEPSRPEPVAQPVETKGETPAEAPKDDRPRDASGKFLPKAETDEAATPAAKPEGQQPTTVPVSALQEERRKRQALEKQLAEWQAKQAAPPPVAAPQPPAPQQPQVPLSDLMFQDPNAFVQTLQRQQKEDLLQTRIATSEAIARQQFTDYADAEQALTAYAQSSPQAAAEVAQALGNHPAPAMWAYQAGKQLLAQQRWQPIIQQHGDPEAFIAAEVERRLAERQQSAPQPAPVAAPPQSLVSARSAGPRNAAPPWNGPRPMPEILGRR